MIAAKAPKRAYNIALEEGITQLINSSYHFAMDQLAHLYWKSYFSERVDELCDYDTKKITKIKIDPDDIKHRVRLASDDHQYCPCYGKNAVVGNLSGLWDKLKRPFHQTPQYKMYENYIKFGTNPQSIEMFNSMREEGYKTQAELEGYTRIIRDVEIADEPRLAVSRNNKPLRWTGGNHRISAGQLLNVDYIEAFVVVWHSKANKDKFLSKYNID